jgi:hypothetical protein
VNKGSKRKQIKENEGEQCLTDKRSSSSDDDGAFDCIIKSFDEVTPKEKFVQRLQ